MEMIVVQRSPKEIHMNLVNMIEKSEELRVKLLGSKFHDDVVKKIKKTRDAVNKYLH